ncbi:hypothetical protein [Alkalicoccobacillus murimartini]|uniref:DUF3278 domain-containing protein n=1 Tax=Alkalicoccobacillus murimartini TaxID=171685 RepID=A0ABT9YLT7_9BACI|nr:hypothetical protein [Alkalicoccobacillus murimartini]MDQ0208820.1 hypothetical protein [Alkalicoccobacillus murimartini]
MMNSWISFLLPVDEYKRERILYFLGEAGLLLLIYLIVMILLTTWSAISISANTISLLGIALFSVYTMLRYIFSGIEFTDIATKEDYQKHKKVIRVKSIGFGAMFLITYLFIEGINEWIQIIGVSLIAATFLFLVNYISLKKSYLRNKDLI